MTDPDHFIYVIGRENGPVKVGVTSGLGGRLAMLQTGCPFKLSILHTRRMRDRTHALKEERKFHLIYRERRLMGEWFKITAEMAIDVIETSAELELYFAQGRDA